MLERSRGLKSPFSCSVRVSNELGANKPGRARLALNTSIGIAILVGAALSLGLLLVRKQWALLFTSADEKGVIDLVSKLMPLVVASQFGVALQAILSGGSSVPLSVQCMCYPYPEPLVDVLLCTPHS